MRNDVLADVYVIMGIGGSNLLMLGVYTSNELAQEVAARNYPVQSYRIERLQLRGDRNDL